MLWRGEGGRRNTQNFSGDILQKKRKMFWQSVRYLQLSTKIRGVHVTNG